MKLNTESIKQFIESTNEYIVTSEYNFPEKRKIMIKHIKCNYEYSVGFQHFKNGTRCPKCAGVLKTTHEGFLKEVAEMYPSGEYNFTGVYKNRSTKIEVIHKCGYEYSVSPRNFIFNKRRCPKCSGVPRKDTKYFINELTSMYGNEVFDKIKIKSDYIKYNVNISFECMNCGEEFKRTPDNTLRQGFDCPKCSGVISKPIREITDYLKRNEIKYVTEKRFDGCKNKYTLPFDLYLTEYDILIEYDGEHHFTGFRRNVDSLKYIQQNDSIKDEFCKSVNKVLYRIRYDQNHLEEIQNILKEVQRLADRRTPK